MVWSVCWLLSLCSILVLTLRVGTMAESIRSVDFEVFGRVQGVFFRKCTQGHANELGVRGWCMNTSNGSVRGSLEGPTDKITSMMEWLETKGSPNSKVDKAEFTNDKQISEFTYKSFDILKR